MMGLQYCDAFLKTKIDKAASDKILLLPTHAHVYRHDTVNMEGTVLILISWSYVDRSTTQTHMSMKIFRDNFVQNKGNIQRQASAMNSCSLHLAGCRKYLNPTNKIYPVSF